MAPEVKSSILAKLKKLEEAVEKLETLRKTSFEEFLDNFQIQDASMYNLVMGIEAITDVGNYFLAEHFHRSPETYEDIIKELGETKNIEEASNKAVTVTMVRSLNNSITIIFMLLALTLMGGSTIRFFIITLLIGTITGTYSSPFVATPILVWLEKRRQK